MISFSTVLSREGGLPLPIVVGDDPLDKASGPGQHNVPKRVHGRNGFDDCDRARALTSARPRCADDLLRVLKTAFDCFRENRIELVYAPQDLADHNFDGKDLSAASAAFLSKRFANLDPWKHLRPRPGG
jgi:hypothetical protein